MEPLSLSLLAYPAVRFVCGTNYEIAAGNTYGGFFLFFETVGPIVRDVGGRVRVSSAVSRRTTGGGWN